jgi:hypothetical protein
VTVGAGPAVAAELIEIAVVKGCTASRNCIAGVLVAIDPGRTVRTWVLSEAATRRCDRNYANEHKYT